MFSLLKGIRQDTRGHFSVCACAMFQSKDFSKTISSRVESRLHHLLAVWP